MYTMSLIVFSFHQSMIYIFLFFFSSRRRHTRFDCDWSSDVCSSDLCTFAFRSRPAGRGLRVLAFAFWHSERLGMLQRMGLPRSEERRVGEEGRSRWSPYH